jgi:hypothetical protein
VEVEELGRRGGEGTGSLEGRELGGGGGGRVGRERWRDRSLGWGHRGQFWHLNWKNRRVKMGGGRRINPS